jgi:hypothetical protein
VGRIEAQTACCSPPTPHFSDSARAPRPTRAPLHSVALGGKIR